MSEHVDISAKIRQMEEEVKAKLAGGGFKQTPKPQSVATPPTLTAKNKLPIRADDMGEKFVLCPQTDFGMDTRFCNGCKNWRGEKDMVVYCDYSAGEPTPREDEV